MTAHELRQKYITFFEHHQHRRINSAPLVPENDPTVLFTTAGMHPLVPYLQGQPHPAGTRLVNYQKCIRTGDIEEVGDDVHLTFFEMLGNWSLGDYFKAAAIDYSFEFLTSPDYLNLPLERLAVSVFAGDADAPFDQESWDKWQSLGVPAARIAKLGKADNWWGPAGQTGPCGPDTEMFYWTGSEPAPDTFDPQDSRWVEIWNDVFMEYNKTADGMYEPLAQRNVDTGMGVERVAAILQGHSSCYDTELFAPLFDFLKKHSNCDTPRTTRSGRIVVEHLRAATFLLADGISPSNVDQGYVLRRLIRRAIREGKKLGIHAAFTPDMATLVIDHYAVVYPELATNRDTILQDLQLEETQFAKTLENGTKEFHKVIQSFPDHIDKKIFSGRQAFYLYETFGFPLELTQEMAAEQGFQVDTAGYEKAYKKHQERSRQGAEQKFKGGLADHSDATTRLHTATHLLHKALKMVLGEHVRQRGSNITKDRLRFDFSHDQKMTSDELHDVEQIVNQQIQRHLAVEHDEIPYDTAKANGAIGYFEDKYGELVSVYTIGDFSMEMCGGPHVTNTNELGTFAIVKEESSSRGVRRIKATLN